MSLEQNSPDKVHQRPETWNDDHTLDAETVVPAPEHRDDKHDRRGMSLKTKVGVFLGGLGLVGTGGLVAKSVMGGEPAPTTERSPAASATPTPGESAPSTPEQEPSDAGFGFSAEEYTNNPEQLMTDFNAQVNTWVNSGFFEGVNQDPRRFELGDDMAFADELAAESNEAFASNVFVEDWQSVPSLVEFYDNHVAIHSVTLATAIKTTPESDSRNTEHYQRFFDIVPESTTTEVTPGEINGTFNYTGRDNSDLNLAADLREGINPNTESGTYTITFAESDGELRVSDIEVNSTS